MLTGQSAAQSQCSLEDIIHSIMHTLHLILVTQVTHDSRVHVAVTGMAESANSYIVVLGCLGHNPQEIRNLAPWNSCIFHKGSRTQLGKAWQGHAACRPELCLVLSGLGQGNLTGIIRLQHLQHLCLFILNHNRIAIYLDQQDGIRRQLDALSRLGLLSRFVGMLTDSRSFLSYPRHEYFRRILCDLLGQEVERGELPVSELPFIAQMVEDISYYNAKRYFEW